MKGPARPCLLRRIARSLVSRGVQLHRAGGRVGVVLAQIARAAYLAPITSSTTLLTPAPNPRDKGISAGRKVGGGFSREH